MSSLVPFGNNRRQVARADEFDALDRRTRFEAAQIRANADLEHFRDLTEARLADQTMEHAAGLVMHAKQLMQDCPEAGPYLEPILRAYAAKAANRVNGRRFL